MLSLHRFVPKLFNFLLMKDVWLIWFKCDFQFWSAQENGGGLEGRQYLWEMLSAEFGMCNHKHQQARKQWEVMDNCPLNKQLG